jgi:predicted nuclease of predicted toxin-antitoxin system
VTFFIDNHLPRAFAAFIRDQGDEAIHLRDRFPTGISDEAWLAEAGIHGWIVLTADHGIRGGAERLALESANVIAFFCYKELNNKRIETRMKWFSQRWPDIREQSRHAQRGDCYEVPEKRPIRKL